MLSITFLTYQKHYQRLDSYSSLHQFALLMGHASFSCLKAHFHINIAFEWENV